MKFTIIKFCLARFSGIFALSTPSSIHGTAISYRCAKFGAFVNSVTILTLRDLTINSFIDTIHSTKNKAFKEGKTSVNSNYKYSHVASNFMVIYITLIRRVCMKS